MTAKLLEYLSALKRERPALQKMKFLCCFLFLWVIFVRLNPDPDYEFKSGSRDPIKCTFIAGKERYSSRYIYGTEYMGYGISLGNNSPFLRMPVTLYASFIITLIMEGGGGGERENNTNNTGFWWGLYTPKPISNMNEVKMKWFNALGDSG